MAGSLSETVTAAVRAAVQAGESERDQEAWNLPRVRLVRGRFEAQFDDVEGARAAARDARAVGFVVDVREDGAGWLAVGRRQLPFPGDERDRYASRFHGIATQHGGALRQFVEEPPELVATERGDG
jgi:hypothetical protein